MAGGNTLLGWLAGGTGIVLVYSAYKNHSPVDVLRNTLKGDKTSIANISVTPGLGASSAASGIRPTDETDSRAISISKGAIKPTLVPIPTQPLLLMDIDAVASFMKVQWQYGRPIILGNTYRTSKQQSDSYQRDPVHFAPPGHSLHEKGLALDLNTSLMNTEDPKLISAFESNGWFRRGKVIDGKPELWHWSYGVPG
jgi:hypothetical protein